MSKNQIALQRLEESLQSFNSAKNVNGVCAKRINWSGFLSGFPLLEHYRNGRLSFVFDVPAELNGKVIWERLGGSPSIEELNFSHFILHLYFADATVIEQWGQEPMLVLPVDIVDGPNGKIPSVVRLYVRNEKLAESPIGTQVHAWNFLEDVCSLPFEGSFKAVFGSMNRKLDMSHINGGNGFCEKRPPCVIKSAFEIVNGITDDECNIGVNPVVFKIVLDDFVAAIRVNLDRTNNAIRNVREPRIQLGNVMIGPADLEA